MIVTNSQEQYIITELSDKLYLPKRNKKIRMHAAKG